MCFKIINNIYIAVKTTLQLRLHACCNIFHLQEYVYNNDDWNYIISFLQILYSNSLFPNKHYCNQHTFHYRNILSFLTGIFLPYHIVPDKCTIPIDDKPQNSHTNNHHR